MWEVDTRRESGIGLSEEPKLNSAENNRLLRYVEKGDIRSDKPGASPRARQAMKKDFGRIGGRNFLGGGGSPEGGSNGFLKGALCTLGLGALLMSLMSPSPPPRATSQIVEYYVETPYSFEYSEQDLDCDIFAKKFLRRRDSD
eukprot:g43274.t1